MRRLVNILTLLGAIQLAFASNQVLNVYNWTDYIPKSVIKQFEKKTGIQVNYTTYSDNETLFAKLKADPQAGYDVVFPSSYFVERMIKQHMLHKLSLKRLSNIKYLNPILLNRHYDPRNQYSLPYLWGTSGLIVNTKYYQPSSVNRWSDLWQKRFSNQLLMLNDMRDVFSVSLISLGYSINTHDPKKIKQAYLHLKKLLPNIRLFNNNATLPVYIDEDARIGMILSGDAQSAVQANHALKYLYPKDGVILWIDCAVIPKYAPHLNNAYRFINFLMQPKIAKEISVKLGYSSPNLAAVRLMPDGIRHNQIINPPAASLKHAQMEDYLGQKTLALYLHYWELLKLSA